ncbi:MAG TPA: hypothetical protein VFJ16_29185 [Longimicrobium sp.]|nr:hypothetical protein [Longimicrobium sp.]
MPLILPHFTWRTITRSLGVWVFVRGAASAAMGAAEQAVGLAPGNPLRLNPVAALLVIAVAGAAGWVAARKRHEDTFLLCLGYSRARQLAMILTPVALAELAMAVAL